jgi:hypothetical protein
MMLGPRVHRRSCACGWEGVYNTTGYADKALRLHSCDTDWSPLPCSHGGRHHHGQRVTYTHCGCRCWPCRLAMLEDLDETTRNRAYGRSRLVDATAAREHVTNLREAGLGWPRIADLSGVEASILIRLVIGKTRNGRRELSQRITRETEAAILTVAADPADGGRPVDGDTTARRLRALVALGWWPALLARETGYAQAYIDRILRGHPKHQRVRPSTARRVHALYRRLADAQPPRGPYADRARRQAAAKGWQLPVRVGGRVVAGQPIEVAA